MRSTAWELVSRFQGLPLISRSKGARKMHVILPVRDFGFPTCQLCMAMISWEDDLRHPGGGSGHKRADGFSTNSAALMSVGQIRARGQRGEDYSLVSWMETWTKEPTPDAYLHLRATHAGESAITEFWVHTSSDLQVQCKERIHHNLLKLFLPAFSVESQASQAAIKPGQQPCAKLECDGKLTNTNPTTQNCKLVQQATICFWMLNTCIDYWGYPPRLSMIYGTNKI
jgi:hypothetical protein